MDETTADARINELRDCLLELVELARGVDMRDNSLDYTLLARKVEGA